MDKKRVLLLGACGYVGDYLTDLINNNVEGLDVTVYDPLIFNNKFYLKNGFKLVREDVRNTTELKKHLDNTDVLVVLSAFVGDGCCAVNPAATMQVNREIPKFIAENFNGRGYFMSSCHDTDTTLLTDSGIKRYDEVTLNDKVLTINEQTKVVEWKRIKRIIIKDHNGKLVKYRNRAASFALTPEHQCLFSDLDGNVIRDSALNGLNKKHLLLNNYSFEGKDVKPIIGDFQFSVEDFNYVIGLFVGDGYCGDYISIRDNKSGLNREEFLSRRDESGRFVSLLEKQNVKIECHKYETAWCLPKADKARLTLKSILDKYEIRYTITDQKIIVHNKEICEFFTKFGKGAKNKFIPKEFLEQSSIALQYLYLGLIHSDGNHSLFRKNNNTGGMYFTSSELMIPCLYELGIKLGMNVKCHKRIANKKGIIKGRVINTSDSYRIQFVKRNCYIKENESYQENYIGKVWCLEIEDNHNFYIIRDGIGNFSGNCSVYGQMDGLLTEESETNPQSLYGQLKLDAEKYFVDKNFLNLRLGTLYGLSSQWARPRLDLVTNKFCLDAVNGKCLRVNGHQWRPFLHVREVGKLIANDILNDGKETGIFNLATENLTLLDAAYRVALYVGDVEIERVNYNIEDQRNYRVSAEKARVKLNFNPVLKIEDGIKEFVDMLREKRVDDPTDPIYHNHNFFKENQEWINERFPISDDLKKELEKLKLTSVI